MTGPGIFDGLENVGRRQKVKSEPSCGRGACPHCISERISMVRSPDSKHFLWKVHYLTAYGGAPMPCLGSGKRLCEAPARHIIGYDVPCCPHERKRFTS